MPSGAVLFQDNSGTVPLEYVVVLTLVSLGLVSAIAALGLPLLDLFYYQQTLVLMPFP